MCRDLEGIKNLSKLERARGDSIGKGIGIMALMTPAQD